MRKITARGQTVEEAIQSALEQLTLERDQVEVHVIDEGKKGFLGIFGSSNAVVEVSEKRNAIEETKLYLTSIAKQLDVDIDVEVIQKDNHVTFNLSGEKIAILIGKRGRTLNALQYLTQLALNKDGGTYQSVTVDAEGYRERRKTTLVELANRMAEKALRMNRKVILDPMPAYERKIIHSSLQSRGDVATHSEGVEPHRYIVIKP